MCAISPHLLAPIEVARKNEIQSWVCNIFALRDGDYIDSRHNMLDVWFELWSVNPQPWHFTNNSFGLPHAHSFSPCASFGDIKGDLTNKISPSADTLDSHPAANMTNHPAKHEGFRTGSEITPATVFLRSTPTVLQVDPGTLQVRAWRMPLGFCMVLIQQRAARGVTPALRSNLIAHLHLLNAYARLHMFPSARGETIFSERPGSLLLGR